MEEGRVALEGFRENADGFLFALTAQDIGLRLGFRDQHGAFTLGTCAHALRHFRTFSAGFARHAFTFGLHARQDGLRVFARQISAANAHIFHGNTELARFFIHLTANFTHDPCAVRRQHRKQGLIAQHAAER